MMNATQYEFDVDADAPVGTVLFTILISVEDPSTATYFNLHLHSKYVTEFWKINHFVTHEAIRIFMFNLVLP